MSAKGSETAARVIVYTTSWCPHCTTVKDLLTRRGIPFQEVDAEARWGRSFRDEVFRITGGTTVPQVVIDGEPVGGSGSLARLDETGQLRSMLGMGTDD